MYQYDDEVVHFGGGRLLLRGVNGSGKSTAMNMLLPFLLTASQRRIDAAGEQSGILKAWMLNGRDDVQPVGYLWIEFEQRGEFLVCGCGIKANRHSDTVTTWWFVTAKRPGIDVQLVEGRVPLSADGLRAALDGDKVFGHRDRRDYRREIERRLFGGASIEQHMRLINLVRSPRVGDRIDVYLADRLADALPQLSEQALSEAAQPLDDLEEHRRNVTDLEQTLGAVRGVLAVYRSYGAGELRRRAEEGRTHLDELSRCARDEKSKQQAASEAAAEVKRLKKAIGGLAEDERRLRGEISALEESRAYRSGQELNALRDLVNQLARELRSAVRRVAKGEDRAQAALERLRSAQRRCRDDLARLNRDLADAAELAHRCLTDPGPPGPVALGESPLAGVDAAEPVGTLDHAAVAQGLGAADGAVLVRSADIDRVEQKRKALDDAERELKLAESALAAAADKARSAESRHAEQAQRLAAARRRWADRALGWARRVHPVMEAAGVDAPAAAKFSGAGAGDHDLEIGEQEAVRSRLLSEAEALVGHWIEAVASVEARLTGERADVDEAQALVDELAAQTEPDPPRLGWQTGAGHCLADLVDFAPRLGGIERAGIEAALESSGLLSARLADGAAELASGELVAVVAGGVRSPLSDCLTVTVPDRLAGEVDDGLVAKLLESISCDMASDASTAAAVDGAFRVGSLRGRHSKKRAEFIGATARRAALDRARREAAAALDQACAVVTLSMAERDGCQASLEQARRHRSELPATDEIVKAAAAAEAAAKVVDDAESARAAAADRAAYAEAESADASDALQREATTLALPADRDGLDAARRELRDLRSALEGCRWRLRDLRRSVGDWRGAVDRWQADTDDVSAERDAHNETEARHNRERARLATIEGSVGAEYAAVVAQRGQLASELEEIKALLPRTRAQRDDAFERRVRADAAAAAAARGRREAEQACEAMRASLTEVLATPGLLDAVAGRGLASDRDPAAGPSQIDDARAAPTVAIVARSAGSDGLREMLDGMARVLPADTDAVLAAPDAVTPPGAASADSVRRSLLQRRDALGAGWDAEALQPDSSLPLFVEVTGPSGRAPLAASVQAVAQQHKQLAGLLSRKQDDALRELLQGLIAREVAEKLHGAKRFVELMNERLSGVMTAHRVGVQLRWRQALELDQTTARMVKHLATRPDLRLPDAQRELRQALSDRLHEARLEEPDIPYRQLIAGALDYKKWHEMSVMVQRQEEKETKLSRRTPLSEGEKKIVTYLSLFAAVAASYDALGEHGAALGGGRAGIARFVVLDDAFAKVSEDNHASLFGLLVELDLDLIATSERLWGTHPTVPELAITEVVRDASLRAILLEHYRWDGAALEQRGSR